MSSPFLSLLFTDVLMKPELILFLFLSLLLSLVAPASTHASVFSGVTKAIAVTPALTTNANSAFIHASGQPTAVTLARVQVTPAYPFFGIVGSLALIALILIYRVYRSI